MTPFTMRHGSALASLAVALTLAPQVQVHAHVTACDEAKGMLRALDSSLSLYAAEHGALPREKDWVDVLVREKSIRGREDARDPWGQDYVFIASEREGEGGDYDLRSAGPDGKHGTQDDLVRANGWKSATCRDPRGRGGCR